MSVYVKTIKVNGEGKDKSNKLMSFFIDDKQLLEKYKTIYTKIELNVLPIYDDRYIN